MSYVLCPMSYLNIELRTYVIVWSLSAFLTKINSDVNKFNLDLISM